MQFTVFFIIGSLFLLTNCTSSGSRKVATKKMVTLLGSYHDFTNRPKQYEIFKEILENLDPEIIFIEHPTNWYNKEFALKKDMIIPTLKTKNKSLGELLYGNIYDFHDSKALREFAQKNKIPMIPYDIKNRNQIYHGVWQYHKNSKNLNVWIKKTLVKKAPLSKKYQTILAELTRCTVKRSLEEINSPICDKWVKAYHDLDQELTGKLLGEPRYSRFSKFHRERIEWWIKRNRVMATNICRYVGKSTSKTFLVHTGYFHRYILLEHLKSCAVLEIKEFY